LNDSVLDLYKRATNLGQQVENMKSEVKQLNRIQAGINNSLLMKEVKIDSAVRGKSSGRKGNYAQKSQTPNPNLISNSTDLYRSLKDLSQMRSSQQ